MDIRRELDREAANELLLFIPNDRNVYFKSFIPVVKNLEKKVNKGIFDDKKAVKAFMYVAEFAAKVYCQEFGGIWYQVFNKVTREEVSKSLVVDFMNDHDILIDYKGRCYTL